MSSKNVIFAREAPQRGSVHGPALVVRLPAHPPGVTMKVLGIDPSLRNTGWALYEIRGVRRFVDASGAIKTGSAAPEIAMDDIRTALRNQILIGGAELIAIEEQASTQVAMTKRGVTSGPATYVREVARMAWTIARDLEVPVTWVRPAQLRAALGMRSNASKAAIRHAVTTQLIWPSARKVTEHECDAAAVAVYAERRAAMDLVRAQMGVPRGNDTRTALGVGNRTGETG